MEESPGYFVEPERERKILTFLEDILLVEPQQAKVLPYSNADRLKVGKRVSTHPLHETFLGPEWKEKKLRDEYYERTEPGALVAELDSVADVGRFDVLAVDDSQDKPLHRLQRVFTAPLDRLFEAWAETARTLSMKKRKSD